MTELKTILRERKLKATPTRLSVLELVRNYNGAIPYSNIQKNMSETDRITLFRTINALLDKGIIHKALFEDSETYYAMCPSSCSSEAHLHNHVHFKCSSCETVTCVQLEQSVRIAIPQHSIEHIDINVTGICSSCN